MCLRISGLVKIPKFVRSFLISGIHLTYETKSCSADRKGNYVIKLSFVLWSSLVPCASCFCLLLLPILVQCEWEIRSIEFPSWSNWRLYTVSAIFLYYMINTEEEMRANWVSCLYSLLAALGLIFIKDLLIITDLIKSWAIFCWHRFKEE